jgi:hypothetical protein
MGKTRRKVMHKTQDAYLMVKRGGVSKCESCLHAVYETCPTIGQEASKCENHASAGVSSYLKPDSSYYHGTVRSGRGGQK